MKNILVTGGRGFVGKNICEGLENRYNVFSPTHSQMDVCDYESLAKYVVGNRIDIIIHSAIYYPKPGEDPRELYYDMLMFTNIEKISHSVEKVLYFGSGAEYDKRRNIRMISEQHFGESIPVSEYGLAKYNMNLIARKSSNIYNLRFFGLFGKYEHWEKCFISNICCKALFDFPLTIRKDCYFDFFFIEDLIPVLIWFIENNPDFHDYNVSSGEEFLLSEFAKTMLEVTGKDLPIILLSDERNLDYSSDNSRLMKQIPSLQITDKSEAFKRLGEYYKENINQIDYAILKASR